MNKSTFVLKSLQNMFGTDLMDEIMSFEPKINRPIHPVAKMYKHLQEYWKKDYEDDFDILEKNLKMWSDDVNFRDDDDDSDPTVVQIQMRGKEYNTLKRWYDINKLGLLFNPELYYIHSFEDHCVWKLSFPIQMKNEIFSKIVSIVFTFNKYLMENGKKLQEWEEEAEWEKKGEFYQYVKRDLENDDINYEVDWEEYHRYVG